MPVPAPRILALNTAPLSPHGEYVLYWMTTARRLGHNFALERAVDLALDCGRPLVILEALRCDYPCASDRFHQFVWEGMREHRDALHGSPVRYVPYVERRQGEGKGLLRSLASNAATVVTDWYPAFFVPRMLTAASRQVTVALEAVDTNGLLPVMAAGKPFATAHAFRSWLQRTLRENLRPWPEREPLARLAGKQAKLPPAVTARWPLDPALLDSVDLSALPIDHTVFPVSVRGGSTPARERLSWFVRNRLDRYGEDHNQPEEDATIRLSPWLHFGHVSAHEIFAAVMSKERWTSRKLAVHARGAREGWWNVSASAEAFLDELISWRELAFNTAAFVPHFDRYESLPAWARRTLDQHRKDRREHRYDVKAFENADTHDLLWNAVQRQLRRDGWFHGYLRMLWGKKILEWSASPEEALGVMERLMNRYALDGRDPNSWAGFMWVLGRYDRPWPERPIFGTVRYMSSSNTAKKLRVRNYIRKYSGDSFEWAI